MNDSNDLENQYSEFDDHVNDYQVLHQNNIKISGESTKFFAKYKIVDLKAFTKKANLKCNKILDFGSGIGNSIPHFRTIFPESKLTCADVSTKSLNYSKLKYKGHESYFIINDNLNKFKTTNDFEIVFSACVFHHIPIIDHRFWLEEIYSIIKPGGYIVIYEHNPFNPFTVKAVNTCEFDKNAVLLKPSLLEKYLKQVGFTDIKISYKIFYPKFLSSLRFTEKYLTSIPFGAQYRISGRKSNKC